MSDRQVSDETDAGLARSELMGDFTKPEGATWTVLRAMVDCASTWS